MKFLGAVLALATSACATGATNELQPDANNPTSRPDAGAIGFVDGGGAADGGDLVDAVPAVDAPLAADAGTGCITQWLSLLQNGAFDSGTANWATSTDCTDIFGFECPIIQEFSDAHTPPNAAWLGGYRSANDRLWQANIAVPADATKLRLRGQICVASAEGGAADDRMEIKLRSAGGADLLTIATYTSAAFGTSCAGWTPFSFDAAQPQAGQAIQLYFQALTDSDSNLTNFYLDTLVLEAEVCR